MIVTAIWIFFGINYHVYVYKKYYSSQHKKQLNTQTQPKFSNVQTSNSTTLQEGWNINNCQNQVHISLIFVSLLFEVIRMMQHWLNYQLSFIKWKWWFNDSLFFQKSNYKWPSSSWPFKREKTSWQNHNGITTILQRAQLPMKHLKKEKQEVH